MENVVRQTGGEGTIVQDKSGQSGAGGKTYKIRNICSLRANEGQIQVLP